MTWVRGEVSGTWPARPEPFPEPVDGETPADLRRRRVKYLRRQGLHIVNGNRVERDEARPPSLRRWYSRGIGGLG